jgi:phage/plasmid-associated DNA primase
MCLLNQDGEESRKSDIYETYRHWCKGESEEPVSSTLFGREMKTRYNVKERRTMSARYYVGVVLRAYREQQNERERQEDLYPDDPRLTNWTDR